MLLALPTQPKMGYYCVEQCLQTDRNFATFSCISHKRIVWLLDDYDQSISILSIICILFNKCRLLTWTPVDSDFIGFSRSTVLLNKCRLYSTNVGLLTWTPVDSHSIGPSRSTVLLVRKV